MYVCATASLPIAAALMLSGVSAGAALLKKHWELVLYIFI